MEIEPASITQLARGRNGRFVEIDDDVGNVARDLQEIDPHLRLRYSEAGGYFVVYWKPDDSPLGDGHLVLTAQECDQRIVQRVREIDPQNGYNYAEEVERLDREADAARDYKLSQDVGEIGERLAHALRKELGIKTRAFKPGDISDERHDN